MCAGPGGRLSRPTRLRQAAARGRAKRQKLITKSRQRPLLTATLVIGFVATAVAALLKWTRIRAPLSRVERSSAGRHDAEHLRNIVQEFTPTNFTPPFWMKNAHFQTIVASGDFEKVLDNLRRREAEAALPYRRERWVTPDDDWLDVDWLDAEEDEPFWEFPNSAENAENASENSSESSSAKHAAAAAAAAAVAAEDQRILAAGSSGDGAAPPGVSAVSDAAKFEEVTAETDRVTGADASALLRALEGLPQTQGNGGGGEDNDDDDESVSDLSADGEGLCLAEDNRFWSGFPGGFTGALADSGVVGGRKRDIATKWLNNLMDSICGLDADSSAAAAAAAAAWAWARLPVERERARRRRRRQDRTAAAAAAAAAAAPAGSERRLIVLMHGLESSSRSPVTVRFARVFARHGYDVLAVNHRGCSGELNNKPLHYHLGFTEDLHFVLHEVRRRFPGRWSRVYLAGFSLGANVIIKWLGEQGERAWHDLGVAGAAVTCVPFAPRHSTEKLEKDIIGRHIYVPAFVSWMVPKALAHAERNPHLGLDLDVIRELKTFSEFTEKVVAPAHNFSSVDEFYDTVDSKHSLRDVRVPLMVINARDDPFIEASTLPSAEHLTPWVKFVVHEHGGHCGFLTNSLPGDASASASAKPDAAAAAGDSASGGGGNDNEVNDGSCAKSGDVSAAAAAPVHRGSSVRGGGTEGAAAAVGSGKKGNAKKKRQKEARWLPTELVRFLNHVEERQLPTD